MANEHPHFEDCVQQYSLSTVRWSIEDELILIFVLVGTRLFKELNFDACDQRSNSNFLLLSCLRNIHRQQIASVEVNGICSHGCASTSRDVCNGEETTFSVGVKG